MQYTKIQPQSFLGSGEEDFWYFLAILINSEEPFEQIVNIPLTDDPMCNLVKLMSNFSH